MAYIGIDAKKDIRLNATSDLDLTSDSTTIKFGADDDVILTHVHNTGLLLNSTNQFQFGDSGTYIHQSADGVLDLVSDTEIEINATTIDINGALDLSGNATFAGNVDLAGYINFSGTASSFASISQPRIFRSGSSSGSYPFDAFGHLVLQSRGDGSNRDIVFATGTSGANKSVIDSSGKVLIGQTSSGAYSSADNLILGTGSGHNGMTIFSGNANQGTIFFADALGGDSDASTYDGYIIYDHDSSSRHFRFGTAATERMRIDSSGNVMIGTTTAGLADNGDQLTVSDSGNTGITIRSTNSGQNNIYFSDGTSSSEQYIGYITYQHDVNAMRFGTNDGERMRILSGGGLTFNGDTATANALDDYEEGTWTPVYRDQSNASTLTITYDVQNGNYTKIGNTCIAHFSLGTDSVSGGSSSTYLAIGGLPFTSASDEARGSLIIGGKYSWPGNQPTQGSLFASNTIHNLWQGTSAAPNVATDQLGTGANSNRMHGTIIYKTA